MKDLIQLCIVITIGVPLLLGTELIVIGFIDRCKDTAMSGLVIILGTTWLFSAITAAIFWGAHIVKDVM